MSQKQLSEEQEEFQSRYKGSLKYTLLVTIYSGLVTGYTVSFLPGYLRDLNPYEQDVTFIQSMFLAFGSLGAILGGFLFGYLTTKHSARLLIVGSNILSFISVFLFGYANLVPNDWRYPWVVFLSFVTGISAGNVALVRTYVSLAIRKPEVRVEMLGYVSAVHGLGHLASTLLVSFFSFFSVSTAYNSHLPIFDCNTLVIYAVAILGLVVAFFSYYSIMDLDEINEFLDQDEKKSSGGKRILRKALSRPEIKKSFSSRITFISWTGALIMNFIWMLNTLIIPTCNFSNLYSAEFNYTNELATKHANKLTMRGGFLGLLGYMLAIYCMQRMHAHYLLIGSFIANFFSYFLIFPAFGSKTLVHQLPSLDYGCVYSWCDSEKALESWQITAWGLLHSFLSSFILVSVTASHGVIVSIQKKHSVHQTLFTVFGFMGTLLNPLFILNTFSSLGLTWLTGIELVFLAFAVLILVVYSVLFLYVKDDVNLPHLKSSEDEKAEAGL